MVEDDRLTQVIDGAQAQAVAGLGLGEHPGDHHDGHAELTRALQLQEVEPAHPGQTDVEQHRARPRAAKHLARYLDRVGDDRLVADLLEVVAEDLTQAWIVLDDEHAHSGTLA